MFDNKDNPETKQTRKMNINSKARWTSLWKRFDISKRKYTFNGFQLIISSFLKSFFNPVAVVLNFDNSPN